MDRPNNVDETQLGAWLRAATPADREELARMAETNVHYLRVLAGVHRENPRLRLALGIVNGVEVLNYRAFESAKHRAGLGATEAGLRCRDAEDFVARVQPPYPPVTLAGLASPTKRDGSEEISEREESEQVALEILSKE